MVKIEYQKLNGMGMEFCLIVLLVAFLIALYMILKHSSYVSVEMKNLFGSFKITKRK